MPRSFGKQPIRDVVWRQGFTHTEFSNTIGVEPRSHVRAAMSGTVPPSEALRLLAPIYLGVPLTELFTAEALAEVCRPSPTDTAEDRRLIS